MMLYFTLTVPSEAKDYQQQRTYPATFQSRSIHGAYCRNISPASTPASGWWTRCPTPVPCLPRFQWLSILLSQFSLSTGFPPERNYYYSILPHKLKKSQPHKNTQHEILSVSKMIRRKKAHHSHRFWKLFYFFVLPLKTDPKNLVFPHFSFINISEIVKYLLANHFSCSCGNPHIPPRPKGGGRHFMSQSLHFCNFIFKKNACITTKTLYFHHLSNAFCFHQKGSKVNETSQEAWECPNE